MRLASTGSEKKVAARLGADRKECLYSLFSYHTCNFSNLNKSIGYRNLCIATPLNS